LSIYFFNLFSYIFAARDGGDIIIFVSPIAHNVPAVYDVLPAKIRACEARPGLAKCAGAMAWE
jgi:hypothetical protein